MTESSYIEFVQWTGEQTHSDMRGQLKPVTEKKRAAHAGIRIVFDHPNDSLRQVRGTESTYSRAIGSADALMEKAEQLVQVWMKGLASVVAKKNARTIYLAHQESQKSIFTGPCLIFAVPGISANGN